MDSAWWGPASLWAGVLGAPAAWAVQMELYYLLVPWACRTGHRWPLFVVPIVFVVLAALGGLLSWRDWERSGRGSPDTSDGGPVARTWFLGMLGVMVSALFCMLILAQWIAAFFISPCWN
jgi:hypothetical protein